MTSAGDSMPPSDGGWVDEDEDDRMPSTRRASLGAIPGAAMYLHGARVLADKTGVAFRVWAPTHEKCEVAVLESGDLPAASVPSATGKPRELRRVAMVKGRDGFHTATITGLRAGALYMYVVDGAGPFPDPASRYQPLGVHGPSQVVDLRDLAWADGRWRGCPLEDLVVYELHVGTATPEGTFRALIDKLDHVRDLGATAIELMPVADFPGDRNWGYDGVALYATSRVYGRPEDLAALVDAAHARGLAVILDVVYNHFGPSGNYLRSFSPRYFTDRRKTPWGDAIDYAGDPAVRAFFTDNAAYWIRELHIDALRLDATHAIVDEGQHTHLLTDLADAARAAASEREVLLLAEDERNEARVVREVARGGIGLDAVWADDFHHEVRRIVAGDHEAWFQDFSGELDELVKILRTGWLYEGQLSASHGGPRGTPAFDVPPPRLVHCIQNHDQVGNRARGDRLHQVIDGARYRAAVALLLSTPFTPMLFMGQEFAASTPFGFFTDHDPELGKLITEGRRAEFSKFSAFRDESVRREIPDPQALTTFQRSKLDWSELNRAPGKQILALHRALLAIRREEPAMAASARADYDVSRVSESLIVVKRRARSNGASMLFVIGLTGGGSITLGTQPITHPGAARRWSIEIDTESPEYGGSTPAILAGDALTLRGAGAVVLRARVDD